MDGNIPHLGMGSYHIKLTWLCLILCPRFWSGSYFTIANRSFENLFTPLWRIQLLTETSARMSVRMGSDQLMHNNAVSIGLCRNLRREQREQPQSQQRWSHMRLGHLKRQIAYTQLPIDQSIRNPPAICQIDYFIIQNQPRLWITTALLDLSAIRRTLTHKQKHTHKKHSQNL